MKTPVELVSRALHSPTLAWSTALAVICVALVIALVTVWKKRSPPDVQTLIAAKLHAVAPELRSRICAHRANNVPKYRAAKQIFGCLELDVVLEPRDGGPAAVYHPPDENHHGLFLEFLLENESLPSGKVWLDVKDLSEGNWPQLLGLLLRFVPHDRRGDIIVETSWEEESVFKAAEGFRQAGFNFSYYLPTSEASDCGNSNTPSCELLRARVTRIVALGFSHLSFDARTYDFVKTIRDRLPDGTRLLTWHLSGQWPKHHLLREVDVYLVRFPVPCST